MNRRLVRAGVLLSILVLVALETLAFASVARTANLTIARDAHDLLQAGRVATTVVTAAVVRKVARLATEATADAAIGATRWAAATLGSAASDVSAAPRPCTAVRVLYIKHVARKANHTI